MKHTKIFFTFLCIMVGLFACSDSLEPNTKTEDPAVETQGDFEDFKKGLITFGLDAFIKVNEADELNLLISPLSIETALYLTLNGTDGQTLEEFRTALKADQFYANGINIRYKLLLDALNPKTESTHLGLANAVFYEDKLVDLDSDFEHAIEDTYDSEIKSADFGDVVTVDLINNWADDKTEGKIKKIIDNIKADEVMFLINALYFTADWAKGFEIQSTQPSDFTKKDGSVVQAEFMRSDDNRRHYVSDAFDAVDLQFTSDEYAMTFINPKSTDIDKFISDFDQSSLYEFYIDLCDNKLQEERVEICIPKFEMTNKILLNETLKEMGMTSVFDSADLSRMGEFHGGQTYISRVLHDAFLKIDEKGAEGAAVTTVGVGIESVPAKLQFDTPFVFIIRHVETKAIVFIGKMGDPS